MLGTALFIAIDVTWTFTLAPLVRGAQLSEPVAIAGQNDMVKLAERTGVSLTAIAAVTALAFLAVPLASLVLAFRVPEDEEA